jgi:hypothetical protein
MDGSGNPLAYPSPTSRDKFLSSAIVAGVAALIFLGIGVSTAIQHSHEPVASAENLCRASSQAADDDQYIRCVEKLAAKRTSGVSAPYFITGATLIGIFVLTFGIAWKRKTEVRT